MKKIVVINGHPDPFSFNASLAETYIQSAKEAGSDVRYIAIGQLAFNPNLQFGYRKRMELEPDLVKALEDIRWSDHQLWIHPLWWLGMPAVMKGFIDRALLPGIAFASKTGPRTPDLLKGKSARIITTAGDLSLQTYTDIYQMSGAVQLQKGILEYCGLTQVQNNFIGPLDKMNRLNRLAYLAQVKNWAQDDTALAHFIA